MPGRSTKNITLILTSSIRTMESLVSKFISLTSTVRFRITISTKHDRKVGLHLNFFYYNRALYAPIAMYIQYVNGIQSTVRNYPISESG